MEKGLAQEFPIAFDSRPPHADEAFPILLNNSRLLKPYEVVVEMFNPPLSSEAERRLALARLGLTRERVRQIESEALSKLSASMQAG